MLLYFFKINCETNVKKSQFYEVYNRNDSIHTGFRTRKKRVFGLGLNFKISDFQVRIRVWIRKILKSKPGIKPENSKF